MRKGVDFVNQFVTFWVNDVEAAFEEPEPEPEEFAGWSVSKGQTKERGKAKQLVDGTARKCHTRPTFEEFFEGVEIISDTWAIPDDDGDGWGNAVPAAVPQAEPSAQEQMREKPQDAPDEDGWVVQKGKGARGRGGGRGRGRQRGRGGRQKPPRRNADKAEGQTSKKAQDVAGSQNLFTQVENSAFPSSLLLHAHHLSSFILTMQRYFNHSPTGIMSSVHNICGLHLIPMYTSWISIYVFRCT